jgi:5-methylcytosine-specific restriction endonuclease McrA
MTGHPTPPRAGSTSRRSTPLPQGWAKIRRACLTRDGWQCTQPLPNGQRCPITTGLEADHLGDPADHTLENLATKCKDHHASKTGRQAAQARWSTHRAAKRTPRHPGLLT